MQSCDHTCCHNYFAAIWLSSGLSVVPCSYSDSYELPAGPVSLVGLPLITRTIDVGDSIVPSHDGV